MKQRSVVLTSRQWEYLAALANRYGITVAEALRRLMDRILDAEGR